jgi:predicted Zn-dependent peptidase
MMNEPVTEVELSRAIEAENIQLNNLITDKEIGYISAANEFKGLGYDYWLKEIQELRKVSPEDVQRVAKKYLKDRDVIISVPSKEVKRMVGD